MNKIFIVGLLAGIDNFAVGCGLGSLGLTARRRLELALCFGLFEVLMPLVGLWIGTFGKVNLPVWGPWLAPAILCSCGVAVLIRLHAGPDLIQSLASSKFLFALPPLFSLDNLLAGASLGTAGTPLSAILIGVGVASAMLSFAGIFAGSVVAQRIPRRAVFAGIALIAAAVIAFL